ncbi:hypothetical protein IAT38_002062 [Cryptococcus sp. DSM 104549]
MAKAKQQPKAGPSKPNGIASVKPTGKRKTIIIPKTTDLLRQNAAAAARGKGKERQILGGVMSLVDEVKRLPGMISVEKFAQTRALEIHAFQTANKAAAAQGSARAFQTLPRHLRRRAASHNPLRVPRRIRVRAAEEIDKNDRVAKKHRRKAKARRKGTIRDNLKRTYVFHARQRSKAWLSTHLWHAKRYHMTNIWGWRLPLTPTLKSFRPAYRKGRKEAVGWDVSHWGVVEVEGKRDDAVRLLGAITGGSFAGDKFESGARAARVMLYQPDAFPRGLLGPAEILWHPSATPSPTTRRIWIRLHPAIFNPVWDALKVVSGRQASTAGSSKNSRDPLQIKDLRGELEGLEIMGPKSGEILRRVLRLCKSEKGDKAEFFNHLGDPANVSEGTVVGIRCYDPRLHFPPPRLSKTEASTEIGSDGVLRAKSVPPSSELASSTLWDADLREEASQPRYTKFNLDARRHKIGLPSVKLRPNSSDSRIPLILIQRSTRPPSGSTPQSFNGFILLLPASWAQPLIVSLAYSGVLIGGLNERKVQHREAGVASFPEYYGQVCEAGTEWEKAKGEEELRRWARKPPAKRIEFGSVGTRTPWMPDWGRTMTGINATPEELALNGTSPPSIYLLPHPFSSHLTPSTTPKTLLKMFNAFRSQRSLPPFPPSKADDLFKEAVLHVELNVLGRGSPGDMAVICGLGAEERREWIAAYEKGGEGDELVFAGEVSELQKLGASREPEEGLIGWTTTGNISLSRGKGHALGTITLRGYLELLKAAQSPVGEHGEWTGRTLVCVKNRNGRLARFAEVIVCC